MQKVILVRGVNGGVKVEVYVQVLGGIKCLLELLMYCMMHCIPALDFLLARVP